MTRIIFCLLIVATILLSPVYGQTGGSGEVGLSQRLGQKVPPDLMFRDETGSPVRVSDIVDRPTVLTLVYYSCSHICPQMLFGLAEVLPKIRLVPGRDYKLITVSFDDTDTPAVARALKINYIKAINRNFPAASWRFLTGDKENIEKISRAVGIQYRQVSHGFIHPEVLIFLSPGGVITKYMHVSTSDYGVEYPVSFSPIEFTGALADASSGTIGTGVTRTPLLCFPHEPAQQPKFYRMLSVFGVITLVGMVALFGYLRVTSKKSPQGKK